MAEMSLLSVNGLTKCFGGLVAVNAIDFDVRAGSITGLIGPNGAGKTTAFTMISGFAAPSAGAIRFDGQDIAGCEPDHLSRLGIARTFQIVQPFAGLNVMENIAVGAYLRHTRPADALKVARAVAERVGLASEAEKSASALTVAGRKRLELARALATEPRLLLLDEVLAGLNPSEIRDILPVLRGVQADGITILMIEHVMQAVMSLCETVHVIAEGRMIATGNPAEVVRDSRVIEAYLGKGAAERLSKGDRHG